jgi:hypothetical protein
MAERIRRYPVPVAEVEPGVFVRATDNWIALTAHFVVPTRSARPVKAAIIRRVLDRMSAAGIEVASQTIVVRPDQ